MPALDRTPAPAAVDQHPLEIPEAVAPASPASDGREARAIWTWAFAAVAVTLAIGVLSNVRERRMLATRGAVIQGSPGSPIPNSGADSISQARTDSVRHAAERTFAALRPRFQCSKDSIYNSGWFTHESQTAQSSWDRTLLSVPVNTDGTRYLRSEYTGDDWIFHEQVIVKVAGQVIESENVPTFSPQNVRDNSGGRVWETIHFTRGRDKGILEAIRAHPQSAVTVRMEGREHRHDFTLAKRDREAIIESLKLADAIKQLGGVDCYSKPTSR